MLDFTRSTNALRGTLPSRISARFPTHARTYAQASTRTHRFRMAAASEEVDGHRNAVTLTRWILQQQSRHPEARGELTLLLQSVQLACKVIGNAVRKAGIANLYGLAGGENTSGDSQKKLDIVSDEAFINSLTFSRQVCIMVSEEQEEPVVVEDQGNGRYAIVFDPLDGSSNIDANVSVGTIFGIFHLDHDRPATLEDVLRPGNELVCSGYALYGGATMIVLTVGDGVHGFTLDPSLGEFILTHPGIRIPEQAKIYSINEGNSAKWDGATREFVASCKEPADGGKPMSLRYIGSMVADVHRTLLYGGVFCYPGDSSSPDGKLRLLYEGAPMAHLVEQAGGAATDGRTRILDLEPEGPHSRCPIFLGSTGAVRRVEEIYRRHDGADAKK